MQRTKPTRNLLIEICAGDNPNYQGLIASAHHGLADCSLHDLYPFLDFDETIAFAASSRKSREKKERDFMKFLEGENLYNLFSHAYNIDVPLRPLGFEGQVGGQASMCIEGENP